ncbi:hypothetical protein [Acinetobacter sp. Marseille-Q1618]|uniref:hypothetical protein n=1 Tax=Acinetobacter sp. Marseille-Q1618 TaxID=2697502 RepID=UPI001570F82D|nr:hypothetical protein [Acinetobacter sp. Marseille-Q1618]
MDTLKLPKSFSQDFAQALLLEQVAFIKHKLLDHQDQSYIQDFIQKVYAHAEHIHLKEVIQLHSLHEVVQKYAFELTLGADILEFIGFSAQKVHQTATTSSAQFNDFLSDEQFELWLYKILELQQLRHYIQENLQENSQIKHVSLQLANQILENNTPWLDYFRKLNVRSKSIGAKVVNYLQDQQHLIELKLEQQLATAIRNQIGNIILLPNEELAEIALQLWSEIKQKTLKETFSQFQSIDFEEFFILAYETWKHLRQTPYIQTIILEVVSAFYEYFSDYTLQELLHSVSLTQQDLFKEAERFAPYCLKALDQQNRLDDLIAALIAPFYLDDNTQQFIENYIQKQLIEK